MVGVPRQLPTNTGRTSAAAVEQRLRSQKNDVLEDVFSFQNGGVSGFRCFQPFVFRGVGGFFFLKHDDFCVETK